MFSATSILMSTENCQCNYISVCVCMSKPAYNCTSTAIKFPTLANKNTNNNHRQVLVFVIITYLSKLWLLVLLLANVCSTSQGQRWPGNLNYLLRWPGVEVRDAVELKSRVP